MFPKQPLNVCTYTYSKKTLKKHSDKMCVHRHAINKRYLNSLFLAIRQMNVSQTFLRCLYTQMANKHYLNSFHTGILAMSACRCSENKCYLNSLHRHAINKCYMNGLPTDIHQTNISKTVIRCLCTGIRQTYVT